jgi:hypothetical protein
MASSDHGMGRFQLDMQQLLAVELLYQPSESGAGSPHALYM